MSHPQSHKVGLPPRACPHLRHSSPWHSWRAGSAPLLTEQELTSAHARERTEHRDLQRMFVYMLIRSTYFIHSHLYSAAQFLPLLISLDINPMSRFTSSTEEPPMTRLRLLWPQRQASLMPDSAPVPPFQLPDQSCGYWEAEQVDATTRDFSNTATSSQDLLLPPCSTQRDLAHARLQLPHAEDAYTRFLDVIPSATQLLPRRTISWTTPRGQRHLHNGMPTQQERSSISLCDKCLPSSWTWNATFPGVAAQPLMRKTLATRIMLDDGATLLRQIPHLCIEELRSVQRENWRNRRASKTSQPKALTYSSLQQPHNLLQTLQHVPMLVCL